MPTNRLIRSVPFWTLLGGSAVAIVGGVYLLITRLTYMEDTLNAGTATGAEVYAGQIWAVLGAILIGTGIIGLLLTLTIGALSSLAPAAPVAAGVTPVAAEWERDAVASSPAATETTVVEAVEVVDGSADSPTR